MPFSIVFQFYCGGQLLKKASGWVEKYIKLKNFEFVKLQKTSASEKIIPSRFADTALAADGDGSGFAMAPARSSDSAA